jgi:hypothetical protein
MNGRFQGLLHNFTHGGPIALANQYIDGAERERGNAAMLALAAFALGHGWIHNSCVARSA